MGMSILDKNELKKIITKELNFRYKDIEIPDFDIDLDPSENIVSIYGKTKYASESFLKQLDKNLLLSRSDESYFFFNSDLLMKLFFSKYSVRSNGIAFYDAYGFGLVDYTFTIVEEKIEKFFSTKAGNFLHAYVIASLDPDVSGYLPNMDLENVKMIA